MKQDINKILNELYQLSPDFKKNEADLIIIIERLISAQPKVIIDQQFKIEVERLLMEKVHEKRGSAPKPMKAVFSFRNISIATASLVLMIAVVVVSLDQKNNNSNQTDNSSAFNITPLSEDAFGQLPAMDFKNVSRDSSSEQAESADMTTDPGIGTMPAPDYIGGINYKYIFSGRLPDYESSMAVLKKGIDSSASGISGLLDSFDLNLISLNSFPNTSVQNITLIQDSDPGYTIDLNMVYGTVSINQNWNKAYAGISSSDMYFPEGREITPIDKSNIMEDSELIALADQFVSDHGINLNAYGQPLVTNKYQLENNDYIPDTMQVLYPLSINGMPVYQPTGERVGVNISISLRDKKVTSLYNLSTQNYDSAPYQTTGDLDTIRQLVEQGGLYGYIEPNPSDNIDVDLSDPVIGYALTSKYDENEIYTEYLVPSLIFPVESQDYNILSMRQNVVIPLIQDFIEDYGKDYPLMEPAAPR
jgi:hypothetical protein